MLYLACLLVTLVMVVSITVIGRRIAALLPEPHAAIGRFALAPVLGLAAVTLYATLHGWLWPFTLATTALPLAAAVLICAWWERDRRTLVVDLATIAAVTVITSSTVLMPLLRFDTYDPFNDTFTYLMHGQWLQSHAFSETAPDSGQFPALTQVRLYQNAGHRMGASFVLAFVQAAFDVPWSYQVYPAVVSVALTAGAFAVAGIVQIVTPCGRGLAILITIATATLMNGFASGATAGFMPQTFGLAFAVGALGLLGALLAEHGPATPAAPPPVSLPTLALQAIPTALLISALAYAYNDMLPFVAAGIVLYLLARLLVARAGLPRTLLVLVVVAAQSLVVVNWETVRIVKNFLDTVLAVGGGVMVIGWPVPWPVSAFVAHAFGLKSGLEGGWLLENRSATLAVLVVLLVLVVGTLAVLFRDRRRLAPLGPMIGLIGVLAIAFLHFRYNAAPHWPGDVGQGFLQLKTVSWMSPFVSVLAGVAFARLANGTGGRRFERPIAIVLTATIALAVYWNFRAATVRSTPIRAETGWQTSSFDALLALRELVRSVPADKPIYLDFGSAHHKLRQMVAYVLHDRPLAGDYRDDSYMTATIRPDERVMPRGVADWVLTLASPADIAARDAPIVGTMILKRVDARRSSIERDPPDARLAGLRTNTVDIELHATARAAGVAHR